MQRFRLTLCLFLLLHGFIFLAGFIGPYDPTVQHRDFPYASPTRVHWIDPMGRYHLRPFVYGLAPRPDGDGYAEDRSAVYPIRLFVHATDRAGRDLSNWHLFGVPQPGNIFLLGTDTFGRDQLSRLLHGGQLSLAAALLAAMLSLLLGLALGTVSGFAGGWVDVLLMRASELAMAVPWLYLLLAVRALLPLHLEARQTFFLISGLIGLIGWARPGRVIRGVVLSAKQRGFVLAARGFGASDLYLIRRHILPQLFPLLLTQAVLLIPQFVIAEVVLSFLGLGVGEPAPSWGNMLSSLQQYGVMSRCWWLAAPALMLVFTSSTYLAVADMLERRLKSGAT
jgi:peptide/nickel transport system permease protein